jgi:hypothetical protein
VAAARAPGALPVVRRARRDVPHEHGVERADVHAELQRRRADERVDLLALPLELVLDSLTDGGRHLGRVLGHAEHPVVAVEDVQVEVVGIRHLPAHLPAAAPRHAQTRGTTAHGRPAASLAAPPALVLEEAKLSGIELAGSRAAGQRPPPALEYRRHQDPELAQRFPEVFEEGLDVFAGDTPGRHGARHLRRALPDPLQHARTVVWRAPAQLQALGPARELGQVAVLDLLVSVPPESAEDPRVLVPEHAQPAVVIE